MLTVLLLAQLAGAQPANDSVYATPALRDFIARAALGNRAPPPELAGYEATAETEFGFVLRDSVGREVVGQMEQAAAIARWAREGRYDLHVVGYRSQSLGAPYSALTFTRMYTVPTLYGNRLNVGLNEGIAATADEQKSRARRRARDSTAGLEPQRAIHPLAEDRDRYYRFTGGDTVAIVHASDRAMRIVRVQVEPITDPRANFVGFRGALDFDADRHHLVRMRGAFVFVEPWKDPWLARSMGATGAAYVEFENAEIGGKYWLPVYQRSEFQVQAGLLGDVRPVYRVLTRFRDYVLDTSRAAPADDTARLAPFRARLTFAAPDSVSGYGGWVQNLGTASSRVGSDDFVEFAPDAWRRTGDPRFDPWPRRLPDVLRYNRVEGMFTGLSGTVHFRDAAPGLTARGTIGWAWEEATARGSGSITLARSRWIHSVRGERALTSTNDFPQTLEGGLSLGPLFSGVDDHDYVDRSVVAIAATRIVRNVDRALLTLEVGASRDRAAVARLRNSVLGTKAFRPNRGVLEGDYAHAAAIVEFHPRVTGDALTPGLGARARVEAATGDLAWQRIDVRVAARQYWRGLVFASRVDAGAVTGEVIPPQQLFEIGGGMNLPSYEYKEFAGDVAALGRGLVAYYLPVFRAPRRLMGLVLPGISPGIGAGIHGGWSDIATQAGQTAVLSLVEGTGMPTPVETGRIRATVDIRLTLLSGAIGFGLARPVDSPGPWKPFFVWGAAF